MALALQNIAKLYQQQTLTLFYIPLYKEFVDQELAADKSLEGSKIQFAQVYPSFMENAFTSNISLEESKSNLIGAAASQINNTHACNVIDQYKAFFDQDQNREVLHMALDHVASIIIKMQSAAENKIDSRAANYFDATFKAHFRQLEKSI